jgi:MoaA/NifB/PqqE/SkfB family radical SAM enzyme
LVQASQLAAEKGMSLIWDIPVPYSAFNPVALENEGEISPTAGAGVAWLYIEPDGDVLHFQGSQKVLGNLLSTDWETIWHSR